MNIYNPFKWHKVKNIRGKYAIRRLSLLCGFWIYQDLKDIGYTWSRGDYFFKDCWVDNEPILDCHEKRIP